MTDIPNSGALAGIRVIEMGSFIAGPFCGQLLADLGPTSSRSSRRIPAT